MVSEMKAIDILLDAASVPIRWRIEREIMGREKTETVTLDELTEYPVAREHLDYLTGNTDLKSLSGMEDSVFENACGKLCDLGLRKGIPELDRRIEPYLKFLGELIENRDSDEYRNTVPVARDYIATLVASSLNVLGYHDTRFVRKHLSGRFRKLAGFVEKFNPETFHASEKIVDPQVYWGAKVKILSPQWLADSSFPLPTMYDAFTWPSFSGSKSFQVINDIIRLCLSEEYQGLPPAYNMIIPSKRKHMLTVPLIKLPGYKNGKIHPRQVDRLLRILSRLAPFPSAKSDPWFKKSLEWLEGLVDKDGLCRIPKDALKHDVCGGWILGMRPSLEPKPRTYEKRVLEATFRFFLIKEVVGGKKH